jgi:ATPases involved in chromosome partitioning
MAHTISVSIQKGGVGKTTCVVGLGEALSHAGQRVLAIDLDAQANATRWMLGGPIATGTADISDVLEGNAKLEETIFTTGHGPDLVPASQHLSGVGAQMTNYSVLANILSSSGEIAEKDSDRTYDYYLIDTPPYIGTLVFNALTASDSYLVPIQLEGLSISGLKTFAQAVEHIQQSTNPDLDLLGIFANQVDVRRRTTRDGWRQLKDEHGDNLFDCRLRQRTAVSDAATYSEPVLERGDDHTRETFTDLANEVIRRTQ